jgi:hypothetical protein
MTTVQRLHPAFRARRPAAAALPLVFLAACGIASSSGAGSAPPASSTATAGPTAALSRTAPAAQSGQAQAASAVPSHSRASQAAAATPGTAAPSASGTAAPPAAAAAPSTTVPGAPNCPMLPADNVWNTDISQLPVSPHSAAWMRSMDSASTDLHPDFGPNGGGYPFGIPYNIVTNSHPLVRIAFSDRPESDKGPYPFGADTRIEGGQHAGGDRHAIMVNAQTCTLYELFDARYSARRPTAGSGAIWHLRSNALRPAGWTSADAAGLPILPGLLNFRQVRQAVATGTPITHAIRFTADRTRTAFIWPARHEAGSSSSRSLPPMGARFRLKASFPVARFCANSAPDCKDAKAILTEMQHYGLILADNGSNWFFQGTAQPRWPDALIALLKRIPARAFQAVDESCLRVSQNSGRATAKSGCPIG